VKLALPPLKAVVAEEIERICGPFTEPE
jgi:hypothetical protein